MEKVEISVIDEGKTLATIVAPLPLELGRQSIDDSGTFKLQGVGDYHRIAIAPISNVAIPRKYLKIQRSGGNQIQVTNIHGRTKFVVALSNKPILPGQSVELEEDSLLKLTDGIHIRIRAASVQDSVPAEPQSMGFRTLSIPADVDSANHPTPARLGELVRKGQPSDEGKVAVQLVRQSLDVLKKAAGSDEYFDAAVRSVASMVELDRAYVFLYANGSWKTRARFSVESDTAESYTDSSQAVALPSGSASLLERVLENKRTIIYEPESSMFTAGSSLMALERAVAAPMVDERGTVIGVLYGDRIFGSDRNNEPIGELEATLLELMASAVGSGLARQKEATIRASLTQFFSPAVTNRLAQDEDLLSGRDADVTVLFCDIRGFSAITERVGPKGTIEWINDVLTELSECVIRTDGVLVDYIGDELMAMWGAPADQSDHAVRACRAALDMLDHVEPLRKRYHEVTPDRFGIGIGINSGTARVGNTGSRVKFKYGPLGNTVNVASRVQGMTKKFGVPILITESTQRLLDVPSSFQLEQPFASRRIADAKPLGVEEVVTLYQLHSGMSEDWMQLRDRYERALAFYHESDLTNAARELASLVHDHSSDAPSVLLLGRVVNSLTQPESRGNPVFVFDSK